ncbi:MFS general substrate transporter [Pseudovirgaria hyperparasitica]|uniref:MFS general substrate transporter n=1 Tax=Pseudovirgaria hyperparasitica TaxID=470096 RepID=A0A6A6VZT1_9PEZI|nr:MFS general substrate transporter [Pseudovirgaria hyperparasitica]KAF2756162.1 MFS general substrate transporter [Pseudovirgaria hyperparasitica]
MATQPPTPNKPIPNTPTKPSHDITQPTPATPTSFAAKDPTWHTTHTKSLLRKIDLHLLPLLITMYLLNFLDRSNLAQARLGTLEADLHMSGPTDFNLATSILFVGYLLMQLPSNLLLTRLRPSVYLGAAMALWGAISAAQAGTRSFGDLVAARFFLGFAEAPFFPGAVMLLSSWYTRAELAHRVAWFYSGSSLANAFGGLVGAGVLGGMDGACGIAGWRWLFVIEGVVTVCVAGVAAVVLPDYPATTGWLGEEERAYARWRLEEDAGEGDEAGASGIVEGVRMAFRDGRLYVFTLVQHASLLSQTFQYFFPSIVQTLGYGRTETLLITAPVWIGTFLVSLAVTYSSGKTGDRSLHIILLMMVSFVGNVIATATTNVPARFFAMFLMPMGAVAAYQVILAWVANSFSRPLVKRSACISFANMIGNTANIYGPYMYPKTDSPRYIPGGSATAAVALFVAGMAGIIRLLLARENSKLQKREEADPEETNGRVDERARGFRYIL